MSKTVFVVGAGASFPFGLPLGNELRQQILEMMNKIQNPELSGVFQGFKPEEVASFRDEFDNSNQNSIDAFLALRQEFTQLGKRAIAACILPLECSATETRDWNWLRYLFNEVGFAHDLSRLNDFVFVTFNYDRLIEHFFYTSLKSSRGEVPADMGGIMKSLTVLHVHGSFGDYDPWGNRVLLPGRFKLNRLTHSSPVMSNIESRFQLVHEGDEDPVELKAARTEISKASRLVFLGLGYNRENLKKLGLAPRKHYAEENDMMRELDALEPSKFCGGTAFGLGQGEIARIGDFYGCKPVFGSGDQGCLSFLQEFDALPHY